MNLVFRCGFKVGFLVKGGDEEGVDGGYRRGCFRGLVVSGVVVVVGVEQKEQKRGKWEVKGFAGEGGEGYGVGLWFPGKRAATGGLNREATVVVKRKMKNDNEN